MKTRSILKSEALEALKGNWGLAIVAFIIVGAASCLLSFILGMIFPVHINSNPRDMQEIMQTVYFAYFAPSQLLISIVLLLVIGPLNYGIKLFCLELIKTRQATIDLLFVPYNNIVKIFLARLLVTVLTYIGFMFCVIPGIIISLMLAMVPFIMVDEPDIDFWEAIKKSAAMMRGHKMDLFVLGLSFLGWIILGVISCGIGLLWVSPYMYATFANFYLDLKGENNEVVEQL